MAGVTTTAPWMADATAVRIAIIQQRRQLRLTQAEAGALIGVSDRTYRAFENGHSDLPSLKLFQLCGRLGLGLKLRAPTLKRKKTSVSVPPQTIG
ncbi:MAG: helix-turn-helix domain-containing protein [Caenispirillum sp.]|nr:helix-turn-helix domain-containing protein [Caenispirillum sp.]